MMLSARDINFKFLYLRDKSLLHPAQVVKAYKVKCHKFACIDPVNSCSDVVEKKRL
jgi:hypothetical protein